MTAPAEDYTVCLIVVAIAVIVGVLIAVAWFVKRTKLQRGARAIQVMLSPTPVQVGSPLNYDITVVPEKPFNTDAIKVTLECSRMEFFYSIHHHTDQHGHRRTTESLDSRTSPVHREQQLQPPQPMQAGVPYNYKGTFVAPPHVPPSTPPQEMNFQAPYATIRVYRDQFGQLKCSKSGSFSFGHPAPYTTFFAVITWSVKVEVSIPGALDLVREVPLEVLGAGPAPAPAYGYAPPPPGGYK